MTCSTANSQPSSTTISRKSRRRSAPDRPATIAGIVAGTHLFVQKCAVDPSALRFCTVWRYSDEPVCFAQNVGSNTLILQLLNTLRGFFLQLRFLFFQQLLELRASIVRPAATAHRAISVVGFSAVRWRLQESEFGIAPVCLPRASDERVLNSSQRCCQSPVFFCLLELLGRLLERIANASCSGSIMSSSSCSVASFSSSVPVRGLPAPLAMA